MAEPWIRVHADLAGKPVVMRAVEALKVNPHEAMGLLVQFWGAVSRHVLDGHVGAHTDATIEAWAGWHRTRGRFASWIRASHLDDDGRVKEWDEYAGRLELRRATERNRLRVKRERVRQQLHNVGQPTQDVAQHPTNKVDDVVQPLQGVGPRARERDETIRNEIGTRATTPTARAVSDSTVALPAFAALAERLPAGDRVALGQLLALVPSPATWVAELTASLDGMAGHVMATPEQLGEAVRDFLGNGAGEAPSLRRLRRYIEGAVHPAYVSPYRTPGPKGGARNDAALDAWEGEHGKH